MQRKMHYKNKKNIGKRNNGENLKKRVKYSNEKLSKNGKLMMKIEKEKKWEDLSKTGKIQ